MTTNPLFHQSFHPPETTASSPNSVASADACLSDCRLLLFGSKNRVTPPMKNQTTALQDAEKAITEELYGMTFKEREGALHDIHGVSDCVDEHPDFVQSKLAELDQELQRRRSQFPTKSTQALELAVQQSPEYVRGMYLLFLRCEAFQIRPAADRMIRHFDVKKDLFGAEKLGRDITLQDFDKFDMDCLKVGFFQLLPQRDRAGRAIFMKTWYHQSYHTKENVWRVLWYIYQVALIDEETQKRGLVAVIYNVDPNWKETFDAQVFAGVGQLIKATALRHAAVHYCFLDSAFGTIIKFISLAVDRNSRTRTRLHHGNHLEVQYDLLSFGIPISAMPVNSDGVMRVKEHSKWIKNRQTHEMLLHKSASSHRCPMKVIMIPSSDDVLFGRGKIYQLHVGNLKLGNVLEERGAEYHSLKKSLKTAMAMEVVQQMKRNGTRFLIRLDNKNDGLWVEADDPTAADSVGHRFRNRKPPAEPSQSQPSSRSKSTALTVQKRRPGNTKRELVKTSSYEQGRYVATKRLGFDDDRVRQFHEVS